MLRQSKCMCKKSNMNWTQLVSSKRFDDYKDFLVSNSKNSSDLDSSVLAVLLKNGVFQCFVPKEYGGSDLCQKDLLCITESLGVDLSTFTLVNQTCIASRLLQIYGTEEQKQKYLPKLASFQMKPAICLRDLLVFISKKTDLNFLELVKRRKYWPTKVWIRS